MSEQIPTRPEPPEVLAAIYRHFRDFFDLAERRRRWSLADDVPWGQCNRSLNPAVADVVQTFCAVELYLPDYLAKGFPMIRANRGRSWSLAAWGYEESKHSMVLEDWLLKSGMRTDEQVADMHREVFSHEWDLPYDNSCGMLIYTVFQELATRIHYTRLVEVVRREGGCPALEKALTLIAVDEAAHADFFRRLVTEYLKYDRPGTLEQIRRVMTTFSMPAVHMLADGMQRISEVRRLELFNEEICHLQVFEPTLAKWGVQRSELRRTRREISTPAVRGEAEPQAVSGH
jgi:acyl-[acyl-carrier-protein] desaturase